MHQSFAQTKSRWVSSKTLTVWALHLNVTNIGHWYDQTLSWPNSSSVFWCTYCVTLLIQARWFDIVIYNLWLRWNLKWTNVFNAEKYRLLANTKCKVAQYFTQCAFIWICFLKEVQSSHFRSSWLMPKSITIRMHQSCIIIIIAHGNSKIVQGHKPLLATNTNASNLNNGS